MTKARDIADGKFENGTISQGSSGVTRYSEMWVEDDNHAELTFATPNDKQGRINFTDPDANNQGRFIYDHADNSLAIHTNGSERMSIDSSGNVGIGTTSPSNPLDIVAANTLGSSFTGGTFGQGIIVSPTSYNNGHFVSLIEGSYVDNYGKPNVRVGAMYNGSGSNICFGTSNAYGSGVTNEAMRINSDGRVLISKTTTAEATEGIRFDGATGSNKGRGFFCTDNNYCLSLRRNTDNGSMILFKREASTVGSISSTTSATSYNTSSDHRLKENVEDMTGAITRVKQLQPRRFSWIVDDEDAANVDGFLAHEAQSVVPEAVTGTHNETRAVTNAVLSADGVLLDEDILQADWTANKGDADDDLYPSDSTWTASHTENVYQGIDQAKLVPLLTGALQEAIAKIEALEARVDALENA